MCLLLADDNASLTRIPTGVPQHVGRGTGKWSGARYAPGPVTRTRVGLCFMKVSSLLKQEEPASSLRDYADQAAASPMPTWASARRGRSTRHRCGVGVISCMPARHKGKLGWKWSILTDLRGVPFGWTIEGANRNDSILLAPTLDDAAKRGLLGDVETLWLDRG